MTKFSRRSRRRSHPSARRAIISSTSNSPASEAYRALRTAVRSASDTPPRLILVTSPLSGEGKSVTCANLAMVMQAAGQQVAVLDADLRLPSQADIWQVTPRDYVPTVLQGWGEDPARVLALGTEIMPGLTLFSPGTDAVARPAEVVSSQGFADLLELLDASFDVVIVDSPPVALVTDAAVLAGLVDGVLLVLDSAQPRRRVAQRAVRSLRQVGAPLIGVVLNRAPARSVEATYGYGARIQ